MLNLPLLNLSESVQEDLECEFGFEAQDGECAEIPGIEQSQCPAMQRGLYAVSEAHKRLIQGDACTGLEDLFPDTDGRGHAKNHHKSATHWVLWGGIVVVRTLPTCSPKVNEALQRRGGYSLWFVPGSSNCRVFHWNNANVLILVSLFQILPYCGPRRHQAGELRAEALTMFAPIRRWWSHCQPQSMRWLRWADAKA